MKENTFTYTARSAQDPEKMAMFTLHNGSVSVQLGNTLVEQAEEAYESFGLFEVLAEPADARLLILP